MLTKSDHPTPFPDVNQILQELLKRVQDILGSRLIGMYLEGSLANGDFDQDSDIDFVVVMDEDIPEDIFLALQAMHAHINLRDSGWAIQLEGSYISQHALRRFDPEHARYPNIERGNGERLKMVYHNEPWIIHRYILRKCGITLIGPDAKTLIDPVSPDDLRRAMLPLLHGWLAQILFDPSKIASRGYQSYTVLSICRILYTLQLGDVVSKPKAASWVKEMTGEKWCALIDRAWVGRHGPQLAADADDINQTLDFIRYALERKQYVNIPLEISKI